MQPSWAEEIYKKKIQTVIIQKVWDVGGHLLMNSSKY